MYCIHFVLIYFIKNKIIYQSKIINIVIIILYIFNKKNFNSCEFIAIKY